MDKLLGIPQTEANTNATSTPSVATAPFEMGDRFAGVRSSMEIPFTNMEKTYLNASWKLTGDPAFRLEAAPQVLRPYHEGFDPTRAIKISVQPAKEGHLRGELEMHAVWPDMHEMVYSPPRAKTAVYKVPVHAAAYRSGSPTLTEREQEEKAEKERQQKQREETAERDRVDKQIAEEDEKDNDYHSGDKRRLEREKEQTAVAMQSLFALRHGSITTAETAIGNFVRRKPPEVAKHWLESFAWMALNIATRGIAEGLKVKLEPLVEKVFSHVEDGFEHGRYVFKRVSPKGLVATVSEGLKETFLEVTNLKGGGEAAPAPGGPKGGGEVSGDPKADFFGAHRSGLTFEYQKKATEVTSRTYDALLPAAKKPRVKARADQAVNAFAAIKNGIYEEQKDAEKTQINETITQWVRMLAHESVGERSATDAVREGDKVGNNKSLTDMSAVNKSFDRDHARKKHDGLIDIRFAASSDVSFVKITGAKLLGVRKAIAERFSNVPLEKVSLPLRLSTDFNGSAHESVVVVRDEAGNIDFTEKTGSSGRSANWLGRYGGASKDAREGAKKLVHQLTKQSLAASGAPLEHDSDE